MKAIVDESLPGVMGSLAEGGPVDEGEKTTDWQGLHPTMNRLAEDRPALVEFDRDARAWCIDHLPESAAARALQKLIRHSSPKVRLAALDSLWDDPKIPGVIESRPTPSRDLSTAEFMAQFDSDVAELMHDKGMTRLEAETEFFWLYAEMQTNITRCPERSKNAAQEKLNKAKDAAYHRAYRNS
ncbi:hypothetical protein [Novilysobacter erysipheiresistens]|uniref:HEAT repeat domain-containing protein n=1 Tax=Novilysobacter erysipheiresistens TaxID=1749332 RepID=A0ABU7YUN5_9GAMM